MNFQQLHQIYPTSILAPNKNTDEAILSLPVTEGYAWLALDELTASEIQLLQLLAPPTQIDDLPQHLWYRILIEETEEPTLFPIRVIQISLKSGKDFERRQWLEEIQNLFPSYLDGFFLKADFCVLVENYGDQSYSEQELFGVLQALDADFDIYSRVFVGTIYHDPQNFAANFQEEYQIFQALLKQETNQQEFLLTDTIIPYFLRETFQASALMKNLYHEWFKDEEMIPILQSLWANHGNVSSAAKELFLHRNTLLYRLDKFHELTKLDMRNMNDLMFCHLLITIFHENPGH